MGSFSRFEVGVAKRGVKVSLRKSGNTVVFTIPKMLRDLLGWELGDGVVLQVSNGALVVRKVESDETVV